jgi:hypothetical protein
MNIFRRSRERTYPFFTHCSVVFWASNFLKFIVAVESRGQVGAAASTFRGGVSSTRIGKCHNVTIRALASTLVVAFTGVTIPTRGTGHDGRRVRAVAAGRAHLRRRHGSRGAIASHGITGLDGHGIGAVAAGRTRCRQHGSRSAIVSHRITGHDGRSVGAVAADRARLG